MLKIEMAYDAFDEHKLSGREFGDAMDEHINNLNELSKFFENNEQLGLGDTAKVRELVQNLQFSGFKGVDE